MDDNEESFLSPNEILRIQQDFRIPIDSFIPGTYWIVALDCESLMPGEKDLRQIVSYREYIVRSVYNETWQKKILEMSLPACGRHNTTVLRKGLRGYSGQKDKDEHWFYRHASWNRGPLYLPDVAGKEYRGFSLVEVMDRSRVLFKDSWDKWKEGHKEIF